MQQQEPIAIHTGYTSREDLAIYVDGFLRGQAAAVALISERLLGLGFAGANALLVDVLESRRYRFHLQDVDVDAATARCPVCGRLMPAS